MMSPEPRRTMMAGSLSSVSACALALAIMFVLAVVATQSAQAQIFTSLHNFSGHDGQEPTAGLIMDRAGNLYGTTTYGGSAGFGTVFKLTHKNSGWIFNPLHNFQGGTDGAYPASRLAIGADGTLYGTTAQGGSSGCSNNGCGTVFSLRPQPTACEVALCPWMETVLYRFPDPSKGSGDGAGPVGELTFDVAGNLYGVTAAGGSSCCNGVVYKLTHSGGSWSESVIFSFQPSGGIVPAGGVIFDSVGNLYGTTNQGGGNQFGTVYQLMPSGSGWVENVLHSFDNASDGSYSADLIFDSLGNLYGATYDGGPNGGGTVYQLTSSNGTWTFNLLYGFTGAGFGGQLGGSLTLDTTASLYGTTVYGGDRNGGTAFKLTPSGGSWAYTTLHSFDPSSSGGESPNGSLVLDANGNVYGTTQVGGSGNPADGTVFEVSPAVSYSTNFPLTENPVSEDGNWTNGLATGLDWSNCQSNTNFAFGTQDGSGGYNDSTCIVNGSWGPVQTVSATVHSVAQIAFQEVELRLHTTVTPHSITGYEINLSVGSTRYVQIVRWNGPLNDFTLLNANDGPPQINDGDVFEATIDTNGVITAYVNGTPYVQWTDSTYSTGNPGMGFYNEGGVNTNFGFSSFAATAGE
jgi:uncharacterized repeat protein (TIGR03803 family)